MPKINYETWERACEATAEKMRMTNAIQNFAQAVLADCPIVTGETLFACEADIVPCLRFPFGSDDADGQAAMIDDMQRIVGRSYKLGDQQIVLGKPCFDASGDYIFIPLGELRP